jgi:DNA/RNA endonuclease YhcR with UshA esterase domain
VKLTPLFALALASAAASPAWAHHSAAVYYLLDKQVTVEGVVTRYELGNPHTRIYLSVKGADGTLREWMAEGGSRTGLLRKGWTGEELKAGDVVKIVGNPSRDGSNVLHWQTLILADGKQLSDEDPSPTQID